jgi:hypothetical protein
MERDGRSDSARISEGMQCNRPRQHRFVFSKITLDNFRLTHNVDGYSNENGGGFYPALTTSDSTGFLKRMATLARSYGMSTGIKNGMDILSSVQNDVQFAVNEECMANEECDVYNSFIASGKPVYHIEYGSSYQTSSFCSNSYLNTVVKNLDLDGWVHYCDGSEYTTSTYGSGRSTSNDTMSS